MTLHIGAFAFFRLFCALLFPFGFLSAHSLDHRADQRVVLLAELFLRLGFLPGSLALLFLPFLLLRGSVCFQRIKVQCVPPDALLELRPLLFFQRLLYRSHAAVAAIPPVSLPACRFFHFVGVCRA